MFNKMWTLAKSSNHQTGARSKETLIDDVHKEVRSAAPGARLSLILRNNLERLDKSERKEIVDVISGVDGDPMEGCAPLFVACKKGNLEIVEYLIELCGADLEQKGVYEVIDDKTSHRVSPLWCAAVSGRLNIVKCLVKHGADVNSVSDTGSTPVRSACFMTNYEVVQYLVENAGADIQLPNYNGGTCLINSVQSSQLCEYLLSHGAKVNSQDIQLKTALHYAIQEHRFETTKLLLANGADPFLKNRYGDDALQASCLKGAILIFNYLLENIQSYSPERRAEMHELMGSTFLDEHHDIQMALHFWRKAIDIRTVAGLNAIPKEALGYTPLYARIKSPDGTDIEVKEFVTRKDLDAISTDLDQIRINSLLIAERILIKNHKDVIFRIMYRGAAYADSSQYIFCIRLWRYALQLRIQKDSLLYADTCFTALALIRLYLDLDANRELNRDSPLHPLHVEDLLGTFSLLVEHLPPCAGLVKLKPVFKRQQESFDRCIRCCTHLIYLLRKSDKTLKQSMQFKKLTETLVNYDLRMCSTGDSLLHLAVSVNNTVRSHFFMDDHQVCVFPSLEVAKFLIDCGADVNAINHDRQIPLHFVAPRETFNAQIVDLLLEFGAHADQLDNLNRSALEILQSRAKWFEFLPLQHITLKCIASRAVCSHGVTYHPGDLPRELELFVELHRPTPPTDGQGSSGNANKNNKMSKQARANH